MDADHSPKEARRIRRKDWPGPRAEPACHLQGRAIDSPLRGVVIWRTYLIGVNDNGFLLSGYIFNIRWTQCNNRTRTELTIADRHQDHLPQRELLMETVESSPLLKPYTYATECDICQHVSGLIKCTMMFMSRFAWSSVHFVDCLRCGCHSYQ